MPELQPSYVCPVCGAEHFAVDDVREEWCPRCSAFTGRCSIGYCDDRPTRIAGNVALCEAHGDEIGLR